MNSIMPSETLLICLGASLIWAPIVYLVTTYLDRGRGIALSETMWSCALLAAIAPILISPVFSAAGISLRPPVVLETTSFEPTAAAPISEAPTEEAAPLTMPLLHTEMPIEAAPLVMTPNVSSETIFSMFGLLYIYGALLAFGMWFLRSMGFAARVAMATPVRDQTLIAVLDEWRQALGVKQKLRIKQSTSISSVCVYGLFRPVILIPSDIQGRVSFDDLAIMGAHELAHIKRGDVRLFGIGAAARILFWFNPAIKRIAARMELAAEQSADSLIVSSGVNRRTYAACFVEGLRFAATRPAHGFAAMPTFTPFDRKGRRKRLDSILSGEERRALPVHTKLMLGAAGATAIGAVFTQAAIAVQPESYESEPAPEAIEASLAQENGPAKTSHLPVSGKITLSHGEKSKSAHSGKTMSGHKGVDIAARRGAKVIAPQDGKVVAATDVYKNQPNWGKVVVIDHGDGLKTFYAHLDQYAVTVGERVWAGDIIGKVGTTGLSTGPHLHFETRINGTSIDPLTVFPMGASPEPSAPPAPPAVKKTFNIDAAPKSVKSAAAPKPIPAGARELEDTLENLSDILADAGDAMAERAIEAGEKLSEQTLALTKETATLQRRYENEFESRYRSKEKSYALDQSQKRELERALAQMRVEMEAARKEREAAKRSARKKIERAFSSDWERAAAEAKLHDKKRKTYSFQYKDSYAKKALVQKEQALLQAQRSLANVEVNTIASLDQVEASLKQSEQSIRMSKLPKKDVKAFKESLEDARRDLAEQRSERLDALRDAKKTIARQQQEIERLRLQIERQSKLEKRQ